MDDLFNFPVNVKTNTVKAVKRSAQRTNEKASHDHPACQAGEHVHEQAFVTDSAGGEITEGCVEHYYDRIVSSDGLGDGNERHVNLAEYVVMGEILLNPRFKRNIYQRR